MKNYLNNFTGKLKEMICTLRELLVILPHSKNNSNFMEWRNVQHCIKHIKQTCENMTFNLFWYKHAMIVQTNMSDLAQCL